MKKKITSINCAWLMLCFLLILACSDEEINTWCNDFENESNITCDGSTIEDEPQLVAVNFVNRYSISPKVDFLHIRLANSSLQNCGHKIKVKADRVVDELGIVKWEFKNVSNDYLLVHNKVIDDDNTEIWYKQFAQPLEDYPASGPFIRCDGQAIPDQPNHYTRHTILTECDDTEIGDKYGYYAIELE